MNLRYAEELNEEALEAQASAQFDELARIGREMISYGEIAGDLLALARGYNFLGNAKLHTGDGDSAERAYRSALKIFSQRGDRAGVARVVMNLGALAMEIRLDAADAKEQFSQALPVFEETGDRLRYAVALANLGEVYRLEGQYDVALENACRALDIFEELGDSDRETWQAVDIAHYHLLKRQHHDALRFLEIARKKLKHNRNPHWLCAYFEVWFLLAAQMHAWGPAAQLQGFVDRYRLAHNVPRLQIMLPWLLPPIEHLDKRLPFDEVSRLRSEGAEFSVARAHATATHIAQLVKKREVS